MHCDLQQITCACWPAPNSISMQTRHKNDCAEKNQLLSRVKLSCEGAMGSADGELFITKCMRRTVVPCFVITGAQHEALPLPGAGERFDAAARN